MASIPSKLYANNWKQNGVSCQCKLWDSILGRYKVKTAITCIVCWWTLLRHNSILILASCSHEHVYITSSFSSFYEVAASLFSDLLANRRVYPSQCQSDEWHIHRVLYWTSSILLEVAC